MKRPLRLPRILVVDPDPAARGLLLEGLHRAGLEAVGADTVQAAVEAALGELPGAVVCEADVPGGGAAALSGALRGNAATSEVPLFFVTSCRDLDLDRARGLGAVDVLHKPAFVRDVATLGRLHGGRPAHSSMLEGRIEDLGLGHLLRALTSGGRSGRIVVLDGEGEVYFRRGRIVEASFRGRSGEPALLRLMAVSEGAYHVSFELVTAPGSVDYGVTELLARGFPYVRRFEEACAELPPLDAILVVDFAALARRLGALPDAVNTVLRLFDGHRDIDAVIAEAALPDITALEVVAKLVGQRLLVPVDALAPAARPEGTPASDSLLTSLFEDVAPGSGSGAVAPAEALPPGWYAPPENPVDDWDAAEPTLASTAEDAVEDGFFATETFDELERPEARRGPGLFAAALGASVLLALGAGWWIVSEVGTPGPQRAGAVEAGPQGAPLVAEAPAPAPEALFPASPASVALAPKPGAEPVIPAPAALPPAEAGEPAVPASVALAPKPAALPAKTAAPVAPATAELPRVKAAAPEAPAALPAAPAAEPAPAATEAQLLVRAAEAYAAGRLVESVAGYESATTAFPRSIAAWLGLGLARLDQGDGSGAIDAFAQARALDASHARATLLHGTALQVSGRIPEARVAYERYLALDPAGAHAAEVRRILQGL